jgi:hypothetical protein
MKTLEKTVFMTAIILFSLFFNVFVGMPLATWYSLKLVFGPKGQLRNTLSDIRWSFVGFRDIKDAPVTFEME